MAKKYAPVVQLKPQVNITNPEVYFPKLTRVHLDILSQAFYNDTDKTYYVQRGSPDPEIKEEFRAANQLVKWGLLEMNPQPYEDGLREVRRTGEGWRVVKAWHDAGWLPEVHPKDVREP